MLRLVLLLPVVCDTHVFVLCRHGNFSSILLTLFLIQAQCSMPTPLMERFPPSREA